jgi:hypothetical protein
MYLTTVYETQTFLRNIQLIGNYSLCVGSEGILQWQQKPANWTTPKNINTFLFLKPPSTPWSVIRSASFIVLSAISISLVCATCPAYLILFDVITRRGTPKF